MTSYRENYAAIDWKPLTIVRPAPISAPRSSLACPHVISDTMEPLQSMADGKFYTSKRAMYRATVQAGCEEIGTEKLPPRVKPKPDRKSIKDSVQRAVARFNRGERAGQSA